MRRSLLVLLLSLTAFAGLLSSCRKTEWTKQEVVAWYAENGTAVRGGLLYRGSDPQWHYFMARVMDYWVFIEIKKAELKLEDERGYSSASNAPLFHYAVDPSRDFAKIETKPAADPAR